MVLILLVILLLICVGCLWESNVQRKGLKGILSITLALFISMIMEGTANSLVEAQVMEGPFLITLYFILPIVSFSAFQLLFFDIRMLEKEQID